MNNIASINFKKTKPEFQVWHNDRTLSPDYLISQKNIELNRTGLKANALRDEIIAKAKSMVCCFEYKGRYHDGWA